MAESILQLWPAAIWPGRSPLPGWLSCRKWSACVSKFGHARTICRVVSRSGCQISTERALQDDLLASGFDS